MKFCAAIQIQFMLNDLFVTNRTVTSRSAAAPCSISRPSGNQTNAPGGSGPSVSPGCLPGHISRGNKDACAEELPPAGYRTSRTSIPVSGSLKRLFTRYFRWRFSFLSSVHGSPPYLVTFKVASLRCYAARPKQAARNPCLLDVHKPIKSGCLLPTSILQSDRYRKPHGRIITRRIASVHALRGAILPIVSFSGPALARLLQSFSS